MAKAMYHVNLLVIAPMCWNPMFKVLADPSRTPTLQLAHPTNWPACDVNIYADCIIGSHTVSEHVILFAFLQFIVTYCHYDSRNDGDGKSKTQHPCHWNAGMTRWSWGNLSQESPLKITEFQQSRAAFLSVAEWRTWEEDSDRPFNCWKLRQKYWMY